jgi:hypothetical protein
MTRCQFEGCDKPNWKGKHTPSCPRAVVVDTDLSQRMKLYVMYNHVPACLHCESIGTYQYVNPAHGYGCVDCGLDFGRIIKMER